MSKTVRKFIEEAASIPNVHAALLLMEVPAQRNAQCRLYGGRRETVDLNLPVEALTALGIRSAYGTEIGLVQDNETISFVYDHANESSVVTLTQILPHLSYLGAHADVVQAQLDAGYTLHPHIDTEREEYGVFLEEPAAAEQVTVGGWGDPVGHAGGAW